MQKAEQKNTNNAKVAGEVNARRPSILTMYKTAKGLTDRLLIQDAPVEVIEKIDEVTKWLKEKVLEEI